MANLTETSIFESGIYRIEQTDPVLGGDQENPANKAHVDLANRTLYLKDRLDAAGVPLSVQYAGNMNSLLNSGFYYIQSGASNKPSGVTTGFCLVVNNAGVNVSQMLVDEATDAVWLRRITTGPTVNAWVRIATEGLISESANLSLTANFAVVSGQEAKITRIGSIVYLSGRIEPVSGGLGNNICTAVAASYRPTIQRVIPLASLNNGLDDVAFRYLRIGTDGNIGLFGGINNLFISGEEIYLDGCYKI